MRFSLRTLLQKQNLAPIMICVLSVALGFSIAANLYHPSSVAIAAAPVGLGDNWRTAFEDIATKIGPSVVNITSEHVVQQPTFGMMPDFEDFFGPFMGPGQKKSPDTPTEKQTMKATGSGFIIRSDGYILTNKHVVEDADRVTVQLQDGRELPGKVSLDPMTDLAIVKIDATGLPAVAMADSDNVKVGQWAVAIGNPFGLKNTLTVGVVSAFRRESDAAMPVATDVIQTDASINPGNSGGPLVDLDGRVIGINFMIISKSGGNQGVGFAIPSNTAKFVMDQLIKHGKVTRGYLGVNFSDLTPVKADKWGVKHGAVVENVYPDSPAGKAGLQIKDVITRVNGKAITNGSDLRNAIQTLEPGATVNLTVVRDKKDKEFTIKLTERTDDDQTGSETPSATEDKLGMQVQPLTSDIAKQLELDSDVKGVVVRKVEAGSAGERAGIQPGDVITEVDNMPVTSVATYSKAAKSLKKGQTALVVVQRKNRNLILEMPVD